MLDNETFYIGSKLGSQLPFQGKIDEFRIYDRALTSSEISLLYTSDISSGLGEWARWNLDDSSGLDNVTSRNLSFARGCASPNKPAYLLNPIQCFSWIAP